MVKLDRKSWKSMYFEKINTFLTDYSKIMIISVDNVQSKQLQNVRAALRADAEILLGKNTLIRRALRDMINPENMPEGKKWYTGEPRPELENLLPHIVGNIGFCFTNADLTEVRNKLINAKVQAPAKAGIVAPDDVYLEEGPTGMDAQKTSFFQALNLPTKINKGVIALLQRVQIITKDTKIGMSEAKLLSMLNINPFYYGILVDQVYENGAVYPAAVLDITAEDIMKKFGAGLANVASLSLAIHYPTYASMPHLLINGFKNVLAVALATDITFKQAEKAKAYLADPSAFASAAPAAGAAPAAAAAAAPAVEEEEESEDMGAMDLFD